MCWFSVSAFQSLCLLRSVASEWWWWPEWEWWQATFNPCAFHHRPLGWCPHLLPRLQVRQLLGWPCLSPPGLWRNANGPFQVMGSPTAGGCGETMLPWPILRGTREGTGTPRDNAQDLHTLSPVLHAGGGVWKAGAGPQ